MNQQLSQFFQALRATDVGTKLIVAVTAVALVGAIAIVGMVSKDTHYEVAFTGLSDAEFVAVSQALANGGVESRAFRGDGANAISTRADDVLRAHQLAYADGAIAHVTKGILGSGSGVNMFAGQLEREQLVREKEMSELEKIIEVLDFVTHAEIYLPKEAAASFRAPVKESVSMMVKTKNGAALSSEQSQTLAMTLSGALALNLDKIVITDHKGRLVHGGGGDDQGLVDGRFLDIQNEFNRSEEARINASLAGRFGPNKAHVTITSEFDFDQSTVQSRTSTGKGIALNEREFTTETPAGSASAIGGGVAGTGSNIAASGNSFGNDSPASVTGPDGLMSQMAKTSEKETQTFVPTMDKIEIHNQPRLKRLSVSLALDESLAESKDLILPYVKSMVGFDEARKDSFSDPLVLKMYVPEVGEEGAAEEPEAMPEESALPLDLLLENGVELLSALAFIVLLFKGLKGSKNNADDEQTVVIGPNGASVPVTTGSGESRKRVEINPEVLARAQVEDLVQNNPERVAQILSNWVVEDRSAVKN